MTATVVLHISDEDPVVDEVEVLSAPKDASTTLTTLGRLDGKDLHYLAQGIVIDIRPMHRVSFIEIMPTEAEEEIIGFVRE